MKVKDQLLTVVLGSLHVRLSRHAPSSKVGTLVDIDPESATLASKTRSTVQTDQVPTHYRLN